MPLQKGVHPIVLAIPDFFQTSLCTLTRTNAQTYLLQGEPKKLERFANKWADLSHAYTAAPYPVRPARPRLYLDFEK